MMNNKIMMNNKTMNSQIKICDECGNNMKKVSQTVNLKFGSKKLAIQGVEAYKCEHCDNVIISDKEFEMMENIFESINKPEVDILNLDETADLLRVSNQTIYNMIKAGRIKAYKVGREWRFMKSDIESFIQGVSAEQIIATAAKGGKVDKEDLEIISQEVESRKHE